jgi:rubrerythrin
MDFQQSKTFQNLQSAFDYETRSKAKYDIFSVRADQEVLLGISFAFDTISRNDRFIAERLRNIINGGVLSTQQNLGEAAANEIYAGNQMYRDFSRTATEEGYGDIASLFNGIANIKLNHNLIFQTYLNEMQSNTLFCKNEAKLWICLGCGNILSGTCAPAICPICGYPQGYYELFINVNQSI